MTLKLYIALLMMLAGLAFAVLTDPYVLKRHKRTMLLIALFALSLVIQNYLDDRLSMNTDGGIWRTANSVYGYCVRPVLPLLFLSIVNPDKKRVPLWCLAGVNAAVYLTAFFSGIAFSITADNHFQRGPLCYTCHVISLVLLILLTAETVRQFHQRRKLENGIPVFNAAIVIASVIADLAADTDGAVSFLTISIVSSSLFFYIWLHLQFVREHEKALRAEQRIQIMISQIQPHFLFNTLATIQALCRIDPEKAFDTTEKFGNYLRQNIDSLSQTNLIPFLKELEHTRIYAEIEMIRFPSVHIEYDIRDANFSVPALSVQPLVENAIRHGVRIRANGRVSVSTRQEAGFHVIVIRDNGKGFSPSSAGQTDREHIGIRNVRERIEILCGGTLEIESEIGKGTCATIRIPFGTEQE